MLFPTSLLHMRDFKDILNNASSRYMTTRLFLDIFIYLLFFSGCWKSWSDDERLRLFVYGVVGIEMEDSHLSDNQTLKIIGFSSVILSLKRSIYKY